MPAINAIFPRMVHTRRQRYVELLLTISCLLVVSPVHAGDPREDPIAFFENEVRPVFVQHCVKCHGVKKREAGLRLDTKQGIASGGDSGPAVVPGDADASLLLKAVRRQDGLEMPPDQPLSARQITALSKWVKSGAPWPDSSKAVGRESSIRSGSITDAERAFWSYQPVVRPDVPPVSNPDWCRSPIDRYVLKRLASLEIPAASDADRQTLIRRAAFDLTGLPPTPREIRQFLNDESPDAFSKLVDRLLDSPHYGERWGRHWLDVVRYADTAGETADYPVPLAWRYRNYVIDSFNSDKPYDDFLREQIAGDIYAKDDPQRHAELVTATGFLAVARRFGFGVAEHMHLTIQDAIDTTGQAVLGLSLGCARCHDHKYDPVLADDYYAWYGIFESTRFAQSADEKTKKERDFVPLVPFDEAARIDAERTAAKERLTQQLGSANQELRQIQGELGVTDSDALSGDFERFAMHGTVAEPWEVRAGTVTALAQSPFANVNSIGTRGIRTPNDDGNNGCGCQFPARTAETHERLYVNLDFRNVSAETPATGSTRIYVGHDRGISPAIECYLYDGGFYVHNGREKQRLGGVEMGKWYNLQLVLNLRTRRYSGALYSREGREFKFEDIKCHPGWDGTIDRIFTDKYTFVEGIRPQQDFDNFTVRTELLSPPQPRETADPSVSKALTRSRELSKQIETIKRSQSDLTGAAYDVAYAVHEGEPRDAPIHKRGTTKNSVRRSRVGN